MLTHFLMVATKVTGLRDLEMPEETELLVPVSHIKAIQQAIQRSRHEQMLKRWTGAGRQGQDS